MFGIKCKMFNYFPFLRKIHYHCALGFIASVRRFLDSRCRLKFENGSKPQNRLS